ncbi:MAG: DUF2069 domain-containing protein [Halioglobus sp.]|nr:DUF2069 domain-containing protein [Halioglobus sp.]
MGKTDIARWMTWLSYSALLLQQALDAYVSGAPWVIWLVKLAPLALFLRGMLADNLRSFIWICFVCLGYFMLLVQRLFAAPDSALAIFGTTAVVVLFVAAMLYVRWRAGDIRVHGHVRSGAGE